MPVFLIKLLILQLFVFSSYAQVKTQELHDAMEAQQNIGAYRGMKPDFYKRKFWELEYPYVAIQDNVENQMQILNNGLASLQKRIELIQKAQKTIELEYFIFQPREKSTQLILRELVKKANQGVKVRILVDKSKTVLAMHPHMIRAVLDLVHDKRNFEFRYYNKSSITKHMKISSANFRNHRKLLSIDDREAITGGRNIEDKYFDLDHKYNFHDRDIWVEGPIVKVMTDSFNEFWKHKITERIDLEESTPRVKALFIIPTPWIDTDEVKKRKQEQEMLTNVIINDDLDEFARKLNRLGNINLSATPIRTCSKTTFVSDKPGANAKERIKFKTFKENFIVVERALGEFLFSSEESITVASPYFLLNNRADDAKDYILSKGINVDVYTNSLGSTDAFYVSSLFYDNVFKWARQGLNMHVHSSKFIDNGMQVLDPAVKDAVWGVHSKTQLYDDDKFYVGTYNVDNRSAFYNTEMGIFCEGNKELVDDIRSSIIERSKDHGYRITGDKKGYDNDGNEVDIFANAGAFKIFLIKATDNILKPFENLM